MGLDAPPQDPSLGDPLPASPLPTLARWLGEAREEAGLRNPDAVALATTGRDGRPDVRMVLCRGADLAQGCFTFYTSRTSAKGRALADLPFACMAFYWDRLGRQARLSGPVTPAPDADSDAYFSSRPRLSQLAAWGSDQSEPVSSRAALVAQVERAAALFGGLEGAARVSRPPHWGGYRLWAERIELWAHSDARLHDRGLWTRRLRSEGDVYRGEPWSVVRLQP